MDLVFVICLIISTGVISIFLAAKISVMTLIHVYMYKWNLSKETAKKAVTRDLMSFLGELQNKKWNP